MSKPKAKARQEFVDPDRGPLLSVRLVLAVVLVLVGIAWITYYYLQVRVDPTAVAATPAKPGGPKFMADLATYNYTIGFVAILLGLAISAHPSTPMGRNRGVVVGMLGCFLIGLIWICTFYLISDDPSKVPVFNDLGNYNLVVGIAFMAVGFTFATRWE